MKFSHHQMVLNTGYFTIGIDSPIGDILYVSHAHKDHVFGTKRKKGVIASEETIALCKIDTSKRIDITEFEAVSLENAGHILGSTQLVVDTDDGRLVYTGDFKLKDGLIPGAQVINSDILIIESTYGSPKYNFPNQEIVWNRMVEWTKEIVERGDIALLGGYSIGKAQEIIDRLNHNHITPIVHSKIEHYCKIYDSFGYRTKRIPVTSNEGKDILRDYTSCHFSSRSVDLGLEPVLGFKHIPRPKHVPGPKQGFVGVVPQRMLSRQLCYELSYIYGRNVYCAAVTGQSMFRRLDAHRVFPISDHADFYELLQYVERSSPEKIYCVHGNKESFVNELRARGFDAEPVYRTKIRKSYPFFNSAIQTAPIASSA